MGRHTHLLLTVLVALVSISNAYKYIASIEVNGPSGQIYVGENRASSAVLYEVDNAQLKQSGVHRLNTQAISDGSLFVTKRGNERVLYSVFENTHTDMAYFGVPLADKKNLTAEQRSQVGTQGGLSLVPTYDAHDDIAVLPVSRDLVLVNLNNLNVKAKKANYYEGRSFGHNLVYNYGNNHLLSFLTFVAPGNQDYGLSVDEFDLSGGEIKKVRGTYSCMCGKNQENSPFYRVVFADGNCDIDHTVSPARVWCVDPDKSKFFNFKATNLTDFVIFKSAKKFENVAWDFANRRAYAIHANSNGGFQVHKFNIDSHELLKSFSHDTISIDTSVSKVDPVKPQLYIAVINDGDSQPTQIVHLNTNSMGDYGVITLNTNALN